MKSRQRYIAVLVAVLATFGCGALAAGANAATSTRPAGQTTKPGKQKPAKKPAKKKPATGKAAKGALTVCQHGCRYSTIQSAVNASGQNATIKVEPGTYAEGVIVSGHTHDGLHILGQGLTPGAVVLNGKNARGPNGVAQNGVEGDNVNNLDVENMTAENYASNGFFVNSCDGYELKNLVAAFNHSYGLYAFKCIGGSMSYDTGYGHGDSAFYIGGTPFEANPVISYVDHDIGYENVLGYSGTNSKYVDIRNDVFYNNGAGVVPNTLASEPYEPGDDGTIEDNMIFWNNFDYYEPSSPVKTVSSGVGFGHFNYPIGAGVILFGVTGWTVKDNSIFGNFLWGAAAFSDPTNNTGKAINNANTFEYNLMGAAFGDANGSDFFNDGSGKGTCFEDNSAGATFQAGLEPNLILYPSCPTTQGTGTGVGDATQDAFLVSLASQTTGQESRWKVHPHPPQPGFTPIDGQVQQGSSS